MSRTEDDLGRKLAGHLDRGSAGLKAGTAYRLQLARAEALARLADPQRASATGPALALAGAGAGTGASPHGGGFRVNLKLVAGILLVTVAVLGYQQWQAYQQLKDVEETDAAILSSELPIDAYLDQGFQNWLKTASD